MKNLMVANISTKSKKRNSEENLRTMLKAQIENSLELGWNTSDIIMITNFPFEFQECKNIQTDLNDFCLTGSKMFAIKYVFEQLNIDDVIWAKDLDAWQNCWFDCPEFKDAGAACYSKPKFNGGSVFWRPSSLDIINKIIESIQAEKAKREEPILNRVFKSEEFKDRITTLNYTYNVGCSGYYERYTKGDKPIKVCHFHPTNNIAWETHALDRNGIGEKGITSRLEKLIRKYYPGVSKEISKEGKKRSIEKREERKKRGIK
tara:strand:+ start:1321 stop:2103 length:783 start_codon:yes stop_codon:yes gene_type:complete